MPDPPRKAEIDRQNRRLVEPPPKPEAKPPKPTTADEYPGGHVGPGTAGGGDVPAPMRPSPRGRHWRRRRHGTGSGRRVGNGVRLRPRVRRRIRRRRVSRRERRHFAGLIQETKPNYTGEAMRARIQGLVKLEAIVMPDGRRQRSHRQSLDNSSASTRKPRTLRQWRFKPGMRLGQPVPVLILVEISFTLR